MLIEAHRLQDFIREVFPLPTLINGLPMWQARAMSGTLPLLAKTIRFSEHVGGVPIDPFGSDPEAPDGTYHPVIRVELSYDDSAEYPGSGGGGETSENDPETYLQIECTSSGEFLNTESAKAVWYNEATGITKQNVIPELPTGQYIPQQEWAITWPMLNYDFYKNTMVPRLRAANGRVNATTFSVLYDSPPETLLLTGWSASEEHQVLFFSELQDPLYTHAPIRLTVNILEKNVGLLTNRHITVEDLQDVEAPIDDDLWTNSPIYIGHNHFWHPEDGVWRRLLPEGFQARRSTYETYEFNNLFASPAEEQ